AQREVPAGQLVAVVHLPDDLDDLARRVIPPEEADGNVQRGRQLCIHSPQHIRHIQRTRQRATHRAQRRQPSHQPIRTLHLTPFSKASLTQPSLASRLIEKSNKRRLVPKAIDRKSTRLNSSHQIISYADFCLKRKKTSLQTL